MRTGTFAVDPQGATVEIDLHLAETQVGGFPTVISDRTVFTVPTARGRYTMTASLNDVVVERRTFRVIASGAPDPEILLELDRIALGPAAAAFEPTGEGGSLLPSVNVLAHGAVGDGVTDDTAAIQAAIDHARARGVAVYIPRTDAHYALSYSGVPATVDGYHDITPALTIYDDTSIVSDGATLKAPAYDGLEVAMFCDEGGSTGVRRASFRGLVLDGTGSNVEAEHAGMWFGPAVDLLVDRCWFLNWGGKGIQCLGVPAGDVPQRVRVTRNYFRNAWGNPVACDRGGIDVWIVENHIDGGAATFPGEVFINSDTGGLYHRYHIVDNHIDGWGSISIQSGDSIKIRGNTLVAHESAAGPGIAVGPTSKVQIVDNVIDMSAASEAGASCIGLVVAGEYSDIKITGNQLVRAAGVDTQAVLVAPVDSATGVTIRDNSISGGPEGTDANTCPIVVRDTAGPLAISDNVVTSPHRHSVFVTGGTPSIVIDANDFSGAIICAEPDATITDNHCASDQQAISHADRSIVTGNRITTGNSYAGTGAIATYGTHSRVVDNVIENTIDNMPWIHEDDAGDYNKFGPNIYIGASGTVVVAGEHSIDLET